MSPNDPNSGNPPATTTNPPAAGAGAASPTGGPVLGTDPNYPQYSIEVSGGAITEANPNVVTGPHTHTFFLQPGNRQVLFELSRNSSDGVRPNLKITLA
jgi:hypothetical protein